MRTITMDGERWADCENLQCRIFPFGIPAEQRKPGLCDNCRMIMGLPRYEGNPEGYRDEYYYLVKVLLALKPGVNDKVAVLTNVETSLAMSEVNNTVYLMYWDEYDKDDRWILATWDAPK